MNRDSGSSSTDDPAVPVSIHSEAGVSAEHSISERGAIAVAPATGQEFNRLIAALEVRACWCVDDMRFEFDSSFVMPEIATELRHLARLRRRLPHSPLSIFAHADPVGTDDYNKTLSGRRAMAIYGLLTRNVALWEDLYRHPFGKDIWDDSILQTMATTAASPSPDEAKSASSDTDSEANDPNDPSRFPYFSEDETGPGCARFALERAAQAAASDPEKPDKAAPSAEQASKNPQQRQELFRAYMDRLCGPDLILSKEEFLGRGTDPNGKADYQGCSDLNPLRIFSNAEATHYAAPEAHEERNEENACNRRVLIYYFRKDTHIDPKRWPCPNAKEGIADCRKRLWSDASRRSHCGAVRREYSATHDTFSCRFYDRLAHASPCENAPVPARVRLYDQEGNFLPHASYRLHLEGQAPRSGRASAKGILTVRHAPGTQKGTIDWEPAPPEGTITGKISNYRFSGVIFLPDSTDPAIQADHKLQNLGYGIGASISDRIRDFQSDYQQEFNLLVTGQLDPSTLKAISKIHDGIPDRLRERHG